MDVIDEWTGRRATALQKALRLTNEGFAARLGTAIRTVANWNSEPDLVQVPEMQRALDTLLFDAPKDAKERFARLLGVERSHATEPGDGGRGQSSVPSEVEVRLATDRHIGMALEWLDQAAGWAPGVSREKVARRVAVVDPRQVQDQGHRRGRVQQRMIAEALSKYYSGGMEPYGFYKARNGIGSIATSILTRPEWLDLGLRLDRADDDVRFVQPVEPPAVLLDGAAAEKAVERLADSLSANTLLVNSPLYRLLEVSTTRGRMTAVMSLADFVSYALTMDLLENELVDALVDGSPIRPSSLPLRDRYLPDVATAIDFERRLCVGGPLALCAIARPRLRSRRSADYLLLIQERSGRVLNSARRLAVIPKCFHEPLVDYSDDAHLAASLEREMEEELFGRTDVDSTQGDHRHADPMHISRLSEPMRWLVNHDEGGDWRIECTGFGLNLVSGNFEFASLIVIDNEDWWGQFGGSIEANWESDSLRRYSTLNQELLTTLAHDPAWSNEGLFALLQGLRRLAEVGGDRVNVPTIQWEL